MLCATGCSASYGAQLLFVDLGMEVAEGETVAVVGPSGCGKTTLLLVLAALKSLDSGSVRLDGEPIERGDARVGVVLQHFGLFPWFTAIANVRVALRIRAGSEARDDQLPLAHAALARVGLAGKEDRYPRELSGGEQQRVALARTVALEPQLLLLDEPFSALDALAREELQDALLSLLAGRRMTAVIVTHSIEEAVYLADRVLVMAGQPATLTPIQGDYASSHRARLSSRASARSDPKFLAAVASTRQRFEEIVRDA